MNISTKTKTTLILGSNGKTGSRVATRLATRGVPVRLASRSGTPPFDWTDPGTWQAALHGVDALYLSYYPDLALPEAAPTLRRFAQQAVEQGARRIVLLSGRGEEQAVVSEQAVRDSGAALTVVRAAFFCQNFSEGYLLEPLLRGEVALPAGDVAEPFIDADDIADVAVAALMDDQHIGATYELTGPRLLTFADAVGEIGRSTGRPVRYVPVTTQQYAAALAQEMPAELAAFISDLFRQLLDGHNAHLSDGVERVLGRKPRDFGDYARSAAAAGVWDR